MRIKKYQEPSGKLMPIEMEYYGKPVSEFLQTFPFPTKEAEETWIQDQLTDYSDNGRIVGGYLPQVNYTFGDNVEDKQNLYNWQELQALVSEDLGDRDPQWVSRFLDVYRYGDNPLVIHKANFPHYKPANYKPLFNIIEANNYDELISELAHAVQYEQNTLTGNRDFSNILNGLNILINQRKPKDNIIGRAYRKNNPYGKKGNVEYNAHSLIEPELLKYINEADTTAFNKVKAWKGLKQSKKK